MRVAVSRTIPNALFLFLCTFRALEVRGSITTVPKRQRVKVDTLTLELLCIFFGPDIKLLLEIRRYLEQNALNIDLATRFGLYRLDTRLIHAHKKAVLWAANPKPPVAHHRLDNCLVATNRLAREDGDVRSRRNRKKRHTTLLHQSACLR